MDRENFWQVESLGKIPGEFKEKMAGMGDGEMESDIIWKKVKVLGVDY